ncbi:ASCH domain-containing protein [Streptomyces bobili]|uniref:ASCH domain-containing protein n=1 Tax=Streptomyces bobili TaxID=67280 RepID=UPI0033A140CB
MRLPGPLRDRLVAAILDGAKTATTALLTEYERDGERLPSVGERSVVVDSDHRPVAVIEVTDVRVGPLRDADVTQALDEGEGHTTVDEWRAGHRSFWSAFAWWAAFTKGGLISDRADQPLPRPAPSALRRPRVAPAAVPTTAPGPWA